MIDFGDGALKITVAVFMCSVEYHEKDWNCVSISNTKYYSYAIQLGMGVVCYYLEVVFVLRNPTHV